MSGFGDAGSPVIGPYSFQEQWSYDDWSRAGNVYLIQAQQKWQALQDAKDLGSPSASSIIAPFIASSGSMSIPYWITNVDQQTRASGAGGLSDPARINALNKLNAAITALANVTVPDPDAEVQAAQDAADAAAAKKIADQTKVAALAATKAAAAAAVVAANAAVAAKRQGTADAIAAAQAALVAAQTAAAQAKAAAAAHAQAAQIAVQKSAQLESTIKTPLILAAVGIPLAIIAWMAMKRSKPVAGYRRRSRR